MKERRRSPRIDVVLKASFETEEELQEALIRSLSPGGVFLATESPLAVGFQFFIEIHLPDKRGLLKGKCEVVWVDQFGGANFPKGMGVMFIEMSPADKELLNKYLSNIKYEQ